MKLGIFIVILFAVSFISGLCEEGQIDVNTATLEELDEIKWVGIPTAEKIIASRPFSGIDDLIKVSGIGEKKLADIKLQGLACVAEENDEPEENPEEVEIIEEPEIYKEQTEDDKKGYEKPKTIILTAQSIKSPENKENKSRYAVYGFIGFCVLLAMLFILKLRKRKYKNEFR